MQINKILFAAGAVALLSTGLACGKKEATAQARGKELYGYCMQCHQPGAIGSAMADAPNLSILDAWYIEEQLVKFQTGARGAHPDDETGLKMRPMARTVEATEDIKAVAAYIAGLPDVASKPTLGGDPANGKALFDASCVACHGSAAEGNKAMNAPALAGQDDWYVVSQLEKFRSGVRGTDPKDQTGAVMRPMALALPDQQALKDVAAYVSSLK